VSTLTEPAGIVALAAVAVGLACVAWCIVLSVRLRRLRADQKLVLGGPEPEDVITHAAHLHTAFLDLHDRVEAVAEQLDGRMLAAEGRLDRALTQRALVRYDALGEPSGHQSLSLALLDDHRNGLVLTCIVNRQTQRLYCRQIIDGQGEQPLAPEEDEAVRLALAGEARASVTLDA
jgi:hypothetical protein